MNRTLNDEERNLLVHVLRHGGGSAQSFLGQLEFVRVTGRCDCGCPTINLLVDRAAKTGNAESRIIVDLVGNLPDGRDIGLLVFADDGYLSCLEIYIFDHKGEPFPLPVIASLRPFDGTQIS